MMFWLQLNQIEEVLPQVLINVLFVPSISTPPAYKRLLLAQLCLRSCFLIQFCQNYQFGCFGLFSLMFLDIRFCWFFFFCFFVFLSLAGKQFQTN